jgi:hypothetical protein
VGVDLMENMADIFFWISIAMAMANETYQRDNAKVKIKFFETHPTFPSLRSRQSLARPSLFLLSAPDQHYRTQKYKKVIVTLFVYPCFYSSFSLRLILYQLNILALKLSLGEMYLR